jgi:serine phosphatase RsbU (regulator of sigma subunit)
MMQKAILYFLSVLVYVYSPVVMAQSYTNNPNQKKIDSLWQVLAVSKEDTNKINSLNEIASKLLESGVYGSADSAAREALKLADKLDYKKSKATSYNKIGRIYMNQGIPAEARGYFFKAIEQDKLISDYALMVKHYVNIGFTYAMEQNFSLGMNYLYRALHIAEAIKKKESIAFCYNAIALVLVNKNNYKPALTYLTKALEINTNPIVEEVQFTSLYNMGKIYGNQGAILTSLEWYTKALTVAEALEDKIKILAVAGDIGGAYYNQGNNPKSLEYTLKALKMAEELHNNTAIANMLDNIANIYSAQGDKNDAIRYYLRAYNIAKESTDKALVAKLLGNIGYVYEQKKDTLVALSYYLKSVALNKQLNYKLGVSTWLCNIARIYSQIGEQEQNPASKRAYKEKALQYYEDAIKNGEEVESKNDIIYSCAYLGSFYTQQNELALADKYLQRALKLSLEIGELSVRKDIYLFLSQLNKKQNLLRPEYENYKKYIALRDSIVNKESATKNLRTVLNFEFEKKQSAEQAKQDKKDALAMVERKRQKTILLFVMGFALLILTASAFGYRSYVQKQKINNELSVQNQRIETAHKIIKEKNHEITDSINYALKIQQAMLPDTREIQQVLPQSFVLFQPKDIVSGDFYFFSHHREKIFIAAADCTGHGVPGGFMSMIGSEKLNNAIQQEEEPGKILSLLNKGIKASLHQSEKEQTNRDGMDVALCAIDLKNSRVDYAGANRPLWVIRKGSTKLEEIKGTKVSIGGLTEDNKAFETHQLTLLEGDTLYMCSDGLADQFGSNDKKLTTKRLKNLLVEINAQSLEEQSKYLDAFIPAWRGDTEQTDDILLVGIRI